MTDIYENNIRQITPRSIVHELSITNSMLEIVNKALDDNQTADLMEISLEIGEFTFLSIDQLRYCYTMLTEGNSRYENAKLTIMEVEGKIKCRKCNYTGPIERKEVEDHLLIPSFICPKCNASETTIVKGEECHVKNLKMTRI